MSNDTTASKIIQRGDAAYDFIHTDVGQYILARIDEDEAAAKEQLITADAEDAKVIRAAQNIVNRCRDFRVWIAEMIEAANEIQRQLVEPQE